MPTQDFRLPPRSPLAEPVKETQQEGIESPAGIIEVEAKDEEAQLVSEPSQKGVESTGVAEVAEGSQVDNQVENVSKRIAESVKTLRQGPALPAQTEKPSWLVRFFFIGFFSILAYYIRDYKSQSAAIGYCDAGTKTNRMVEDLKMRHALARECNTENRTTLYPPNDVQDLTPCPLPPLLPLPQPESCVPCPEHASCSQFSVTCETGYLLHPNALVFFLPTPPTSSNISLATASSPSEYVWGALSDSLNGLPGFGSIALPPRCLEDPNRRRHIGALGRAIEITLGKERGRRVCTGGKATYQDVKESDGGEAKKWGVEVAKLKEIMRRKTSVRLRLSHSAALKLEIDI